jgi:hypothetical protein
MSLFDDIRQAAPWAKDLTDRQILDKGVELTGLSPMEVAGYLGVSEKRGVLGAANDYAIEFANAVASLPKAAIDLVKPGTETSAAIGRFIEEGEKKQSLTAAEAKYQLGRSMQSEDLGEQAAGAFRYVKENPLLAASQAAGSFVGPGAAIKGGRMIGGALGLTERGVARAGLAGGSTAGAVLAGGDASGDAYQMVMNAPELQDLPIEEREQIATRAARGAAPLPFIIGAASGLVGADKAFAAGTKSILKTTAAEFGSEAIEEGVTKLSANLAAGAEAPSINPLTGVVGSATLGGLLGGGTGAVVGSLNRITAPNSLLPGSTNISTGEGKTPDENAINKAIDANSSEILVGPPPREALVGPQPPEQAGPPVPSSAQVAAAQQAQAAQVAQQQAAQKQQETQAAFDEISSTYGVQPTQVAGRYNIAGKTLFSQADATKFLADLDALNKDKTPEQKSLIGAALSSGAVKVPLKSTAKSVNAAAVKFLSEWGIDSSADKAEAAERAEVLISTLEGPKALKEADELNNFYKALTGKDAPAFVALQQLASETTKGAKNEKQQLRVPTGVGAVPEQGRAAETSGGFVGPVRPDQIRPVGTGSNLILPSTVQNVGPGSVRPRVEPSAGRGDNAVPSVGQEQETQVIPDDRLEAIERIRAIVNSAFGTRDGGIVMEYLTGEKTSVQIADEYGVSDARIAQIAGPKAQETWGARIFEAAKRLGYTKDQIYNLMVVATAETEAATEAETLTEQDLDFEAAAEREAAVSDEAGPSMAEDAAMEAEGEQTLGREETTEKEGGGASGFRVFNPQESGATELEDASAANRTYQKFKKQGLQALKDFELNNLAIDERITDAEIQAIVKEINRREEIRIGKGEEKNAVQKRSTKGVPVRKQAETGKRVPSEDTERVEAATEDEQADEEVSARTLEETAREEWDTKAEQYGLPTYDELSPEVQDDWQASVETGNTKLADMNIVFERNKPEFSKAAEKVKGSDAEALRSELKDFIGAENLRRLEIFQSINDIPVNIRAIVNPTAEDQGFVLRSKAYLIADNIPEGAGRAVFMHEVGSHLGLQQMLTERQFDSLVDTVTSWAAKNDGSRESTIAIKALERAAGVSDEQANTELIAYFIEEAVLAGVNPTATDMKTPIGRWFRSLWAAFKTALRRLNLFNPDKLSAVDVVNLAYGAARLEIAGTWHGTAADFRKFNTDFMGTGEGAQAYGWGIYLAQRLGIAKGYFEQDVKKRNQMPTTTATYKGMDRDQLQRAMLDAEQTDPEKYVEYRVARQLVDNESFVNGAKSKITQAQIDGYVEYEKKMLTGITDLNMEEWDFKTQSMRVVPVNEVAKKRVEQQIAAASKMKESDFGPPPKGVVGNLMRVDINATSNELLDLDKTLKQQPYIQGILAERMPTDLQELLVDEVNLDFDDMTGFDLYFGLKYIENRTGDVSLSGLPDLDIKKDMTPDQIVSMFLDSIGIKGNQFADVKSRNLARAAYVNKMDVDTKNITRNIVIFNDDNIFRVASLTNAEPEKIQFSKARLNQARQTAAQQVAKLPKPIRGPLQQITDNIIDFAKKGLPFAAFTEDLADLAAKYLPSAKRYVQLVKAQQAIRTSLERRIDKILQQYDALPNEVRGVGENSVNAFIKDSTMKGEWGYDANIKGSKIDPELKTRFEAFPVAAQNLIKEVFNHGRQTLKAMQDAVINNINTEYDALIAAAQKAGDVTEVAELTKKKANSLAEYRTLMRMGNKGPYAPLKRFGNYVVVGRSQAYLDQESIRDNPKSAPDQIAEANKKLRELEKNQDHYFVQFAETMGEAKAISRDEEANYALVEPFEKDSSRGALFGGADVQGLFYRLRNMVEDTQDSNTTDKSERTINRLLSDLHLSLLSEQSARQSEKRRRKIAGAEKDMMRAFATQGRATAHFISSLENSEEIYDSLRDMKEEARKGTEGTRAERSRYYNEFMKRHVMGLDYEPSPFIDKALNTTSVWMLLTNPSYYLQNMTQPFMMSLPVVGAKHGYDKSWREFTRAYTDIASVIRRHGLGEDSYNKLPQDVKDVVEELVNRGRIDISLEQDLGRWRSTEDSKLDKFGRATEYLRGIAQDIESINRVATAVAAYRLEARTNNKANAINYADSIIYRTHGDYSGFNAPRISRKGLGRLATQFRKFQLIQLSLMARLFNDAFAGQDADTRRIGRRALMFTIGHTAAMGGVMGLPGFAALSFLYGLVFGDEDEPDNPELAMRRAIGDDTLADLIVKGVPAALGVDLSGKLGMGQMLSILPYTDIDFSRRGVAEAGFALMTGPFGGLTLKAADGISLMGQGDYYKGLEQLMPTGVANAMKGYRFATEGVTSRRDDVLIPAEDISFAEAFMAGIGLPTKQLTDKQFLQNAKFEYEKFYNDKASEIKRAYARAYRSGVGLSDARNDWEELQQSRVRNGFKRQSLSVLLKAPQEQAKRERSVVGGVQTNKANRGFVRQTSEL